MKKICVFILLICLSCFSGCKEKNNEMINIEFKIQDISKKTEINKKNISFLKNLDISGLYLG